MSIHIVLNDSRKEYWLADEQYSPRIEKDVELLRNLYGKENIRFYATTASEYKEDVITEENKGYIQAHYIDWLFCK